MKSYKELLSKSGKKISYVIFEASKQPYLTIISSHGGTVNNAEEDILSTGGLIEYCQNSNINIVAINFSNNGTQEEEPVEELLFSNRVKDLETAIDWVSRIYKSPIILLGSSLGGLITLNAANYSSDVKKIILNCPAIKADECIQAQVNKEEFDSWEETDTATWGGIVFPYILWTDIKNLNAMKLISRINKPILLFHGTADKVVPIEQAREAKKLNNNIDLVEVEGGGHRLGTSMEVGSWEKKVEEFISI